jgi:hypothetical protein
MNNQEESHEVQTPGSLQDTEQAQSIAKDGVGDGAAVDPEVAIVDVEIKVGLGAGHAVSGSTWVVKTFPLY